ncbi:MAG: response regulator transcription factor [Acidobacteriaceae bacterium]|nr:response regulator transcription factor [Acidobacteriaceae bacterium]MBV9499082.1 response regulator transcription factor [Acidobacteriaceae bacterium]
MRRGKRLNTVLIADRQLLFRRGLGALLSAEPDLEVVAEATDFSDAILKAGLLRPEVIVMDLALLEPASHQSLVAIRQGELARAALLFLTDQDDEQQLQTAIAAGARGYMLRNSPPAQLLAGVRQVISAEDGSTMTISPAIADLQALAASNPASKGSVLTAREQEVVRMLGEGRTVREVAAELGLSVKTVEAHKLNLMRKLDIHNRASLIEYAARTGLITVPVTR